MASRRTTCHCESQTRTTLVATRWLYWSQPIPTLFWPNFRHGDPPERRLNRRSDATTSPRIIETAPQGPFRSRSGFAPVSSARDRAHLGLIGLRFFPPFLFFFASLLVPVCNFCRSVGINWTSSYARDHSRDGHLALYPEDESVVRSPLNWRCTSDASQEHCRRGIA